MFAKPFAIDKLPENSTTNILTLIVYRMNNEQDLK